jgi:hypothetical protein
MTQPEFSTAGILAVPDLPEAAIAFWRTWYLKWRCRIELSERVGAARKRRARGRSPVEPGAQLHFRAGHHPRVIRAIDVVIAWKRLFMPAVELEYVMPRWWLELTNEEKRRPELRTQPVPRARRVRSARLAKPGFSIDDAGPYLKLDDGAILRDRKSAAQRLWRYARSEAFRPIMEALPLRVGKDGSHAIRGRDPDRVLCALVCYGLVATGLTRVAAAERIFDWSGQATGEGGARKFADRNRQIWRELRLPM